MRWLCGWSNRFDSASDDRRRVGRDTVGGRALGCSGDLGAEGFSSRRATLRPRTAAVGRARRPPGSMPDAEGRRELEAVRS